jgi:hypothetical protein
VFTFLVDCYPLYAASALAANSFARSSFAAAFPLFGVQMYNSKESRGEDRRVPEVRLTLTVQCRAGVSMGDQLAGIFELGNGTVSTRSQYALSILGITLLSLSNSLSFCIISQESGSGIG